MAPTEKTINLDGIVGEHDDKGKMEELTADMPSGPMGLIQNPYVSFVAFSIAFAGFMYGYPGGVLSNLLTDENFGAHFPKIYANATFKGWVVSSMEFSGAVGSIIAAPLADKYSRRYALIQSVAIIIVGTCLLTGAVNSGMIIAGRLICGVGIGILANTAAIYNCEIAPPQLRGTLIAFYMFFLTLGNMLAFFVTYGFHFLGGIRCAPETPYTGPNNSFDPYNDVPAGGCTGQGEGSWRIPLGLQIPFALILGVFVWLAPPSPRWLMMKNRPEEALDVMEKIRRLPRDSILIQTEFLEMKAHMIYEQELQQELYPNAGLFTLQWETFQRFFTNRGLFKRLYICVVYMVLNQWAGINAILYYAPLIFSQLGLSYNTTALLATGIVGLAFWLSCTVAILYSDKFGRRNMLKLGLCIMIIGHAVVAGIIGKYSGQFDVYTGAGYAGAAFIYIYMIGYGVTSINMNVISSEIFPSQHRSQAMAMIFAVNWICNFGVAWGTPVMLEKIKFGTFLIFACSCIGMLLWTIFVIPETSHKTVEEMDILFKDQLASDQAARMARIFERLGLTTRGGHLSTQESKTGASVEHHDVKN
ncbi:Quinate permease [Exophiala xenobiotica]|nr:Quinate permease [Exophiala xenobiotica]